MSLNRNYEFFSYKTNSYQNGAVIPNNLSQNSITCWNCSFFFRVDDFSQPVILCPNCNKYNRVPQRQRLNINNNNNDDNYRTNNSNNINFSDKILINLL